MNQQVVMEFRRGARAILSREGPLSPDWQSLVAWVDTTGFSSVDLIRSFHQETTSWMTRFVAFALADGIVSQNELDDFDSAVGQLLINRSQTEPARNRLVRAMWLGRARQGVLPKILNPAIHLPTDEICYLDVPATRVVALKASNRLSAGRLVVTNRKIRFSAASGGGELSLGKVHSVKRADAFIYLEATSQAMKGQFLVEDPEWAQVVADTAAQIAKRILVNPTQRDSRAVPPHVKSEVWRRDGGRCVECGATEYLEFDHDIPHSLGGATSAANLQLLCRACNQAKGARI